MGVSIQMGFWSTLFESCRNVSESQVIPWQLQSPHFIKKSSAAWTIPSGYAGCMDSEDLSIPVHDCLSDRNRNDTIEQCAFSRQKYNRVVGGRKWGAYFCAMEGITLQLTFLFRCVPKIFQMDCGKMYDWDSLK